MSVGDINGTERGSAARFNDGKAELHQIPLFVVGKIAAAWSTLQVPADGLNIGHVYQHLGDWQRGIDAGLPRAAAALLQVIGQRLSLPADRFPMPALYGVAYVLMYGARKYSKGNWVRGQYWTVPLDSALRHLAWDVVREGDTDFESGLPHVDHALCNLVFLLSYQELYPEGDDRMQEFSLAAQQSDEELWDEAEEDTHLPIQVLGQQHYAAMHIDEDPLEPGEIVISEATTPAERAAFIREVEKGS